MATGSWTGTSPRGVYKPAMNEKEGNATSGAWKNFDTSLDNIHNKLWTYNWRVCGQDYTTLNAAVTAISTTECTLVVMDNQTLTANTTIPSTLHLFFMRGGKVTLGAYTLTINGPLTAPTSQIFDDSGEGSISFGAGYVKEVFPQWWGGDPTSTDDQSNPMNATAFAIDGGDAILRLTSGIWYCKDFLPKGGCVVQGSGHSTILKAHDDPTTAIVIIQHPSIIIKDLTIDGNTDDSKTAIGVKFTANGWGSQLKNIVFTKLGSYATYVYDCNHIKIKNCRFEGGTTYMLYGDKADNLLVDHCIFQYKTVTNAIRLIYTGGADTGSNATIRNSWFEFDNASAKVTVPIYVAVQKVSIIDNKFNVTSDTQTAQIHLVDDSGNSNGTAEGCYIGRNVFQNTYATAKKLVIDAGALGNVAEWNRGLGAAADFTDNGTGTLIRAMSITADEELQLGSAAKYYRKLYATVSWNPASLADGEGETKSVTVTGANFGDWVVVGAPCDLQDCIATGYVQAADTVEIRLQNESGDVRDLASGTWTILVFDRTA